MKVPITPTYGIQYRTTVPQELRDIINDIATTHLGYRLNKWKFNLTVSYDEKRRHLNMRLSTYAYQEVQAVNFYFKEFDITYDDIRTRVLRYVDNMANKLYEAS